MKAHVVLNGLRALVAVVVIVIVVAVVVLSLSESTPKVSEAREVPRLLVCGEWLSPGDMPPADCTLASSTQAGTIASPPRH